MSYLRIASIIVREAMKDQSRPDRRSRADSSRRRAAAVVLRRWADRLEPPIPSAGLAPRQTR